MLIAITSGKAGRVSTGGAGSFSWRQLFKESEDLLTATIFERLAYLDGALLWSILRATFGVTLPSFRTATLKNIEFWPRWNDSITGGMVEPDVFLQFELGDPVQRIDLIVEAKLGGLHYSEQWRRQWHSYRSKTIQEDGDHDRADRAYFLALGGLSGHPRHVVKQLTEEVLSSSEDVVLVAAAAADWQQLAIALHDADEPNGQSARVMTDIKEALALFGYRYTRGFETLSLIGALKAPAASLNAIVRPL